MYTPGPPIRDKYWAPLGLNWNGKLRERAFADAQYILAPQTSCVPKLAWNHTVYCLIIGRQPSIAGALGSALMGHHCEVRLHYGVQRSCWGKSSFDLAGLKFCIFTAAQIRCSKYIYLPRIMPGSESVCRKRNLKTSWARSVPQIIGFWDQMGHQ